MFKNIAVVFVLVCFVQTIRCDEIDDLINELKPKIDEVRKTVRADLAQARVFVDGGYEIIHDIIASGDHKINAAIHKLRVAARTAEEEAEKAGKDISKCVDDEEKAIANIDRSNFAICRETNIISTALPVLSDISQIETDVALLSTKCRNGQDITVDKVRTCIEDGLESSQIKGAAYYKLVEDIMIQAQRESYACTQTATTELLSTTSAIGTVFNTCVRIT